MTTCFCREREYPLDFGKMLLCVHIILKSGFSPRVWDIAICPGKWSGMKHLIRHVKKFGFMSWSHFMDNKQQAR